ncbi:uncharacterized protein LOC105216241 [Zeugodacus cucurbitae]|uniref:uncharacterized protein LOC105216241 n=1 Tax=Zeugodacus cucurbitae TaxID=28588 RepID=UPI0023D912EE|nr:uncharacterized protein LOC105216241 [Zeugodacus cucurbitae]
MLQQEQRQINRGKNMHHLTFPTNYKQTMNNLIKAKNNNTATTLTPVRTTILDSSNPHQEQLTQTANTNINYTNNTMDATAAKPPTTQNVGNYGGSNTTPSTMGVNLRVTGQCSQGGRKYMEDYFSVAYQQSENAKDLEYAFIGIYDGHGGAEAATFAKEHLMMQIISQKAFWSESDHDVLRAIREGYIATHYAMWRDQENWPKTANGLLSTAGTTATIAFIRREKIYIGHVGDSGIVLGYQNEGEKYWRARQLTVDHKPESTEERARIQRSGGKVVVKSGVPRVVWNRPRNAGHRGPIRCNTPVDEVPFLAVARSLGDLWSYNSKRNVFVVSPDPDVQVIKINPKTFRCLIFGTDGLWNVVTPQEAVDTVYERECINERLQAYANADSGNNEWTNPSKGLVERALKTWSSKKMRADNTSVVTVILYPSANDTANTNSVPPNTLSYNSLPKDSCGLEYTEMCAEVPTPESYGISFEEIAEKHAMPEAFRNFDYLLDEEAINATLQMQHEENCERKYCSEDLSYWNNWSWEERQSDCAGDYNHQQVGSLATHSDVSICGKAIASHNIMCNTNGAITGDSDENAVDGVHALAVSDNAESESAVLNYTHYSADASNASSDVSNELGNAAGFMTFAESYNSFLNEHMSHDSTNSSNSNSNCQIISGTNEILQEQQLYQQQCMSEEEGYSLTKLETRREQQRCTTGVQTFKIFQTLDTSGTSYVPQRVAQHESNLQQVVAPTARRNANLQLQTTATSQLTVEETRELEAALTWEPECAPLATTINQLLAYPAEHEKPLELNSLLQQEREEEQQVAYERLEMQRRLAETDVNKVAVGHAERTVKDSKAEVEVEAERATLPADEELEDVLVEEYIEEDADNVEQLLKEESNAVPNKDASVQINEISSSMPSCDSSSSDNEVLVSITAMPTTTSHKTTQVIEKIEKIEILPHKLPTKLERLSNQTLLTQKTPRHTQYKKATAATTAANATSNNKSEKVKVTTYEFTSRPPKACPARTSLKRAQTQFPNIPNENARAASEATSAHELSKRRRYDAYNDFVLGAVSSTSNKTDIDADNTNSNNNCRNRRCNSNASLAHAGSTNCGTIALEKRQLRSNSGIVDYSKRTLRTRNSLTKDLKAKASLTSTMRRVTTQFLHETAVSLMSSNSALAQQRQQQRSANGGANSSLSLNRSGSGTNSSNCSSGSSVGRRSRAEKLLTTSTDNLEAAFSHVINLRSRKVAHFAVAAAAAAAAVNHTQTTRRPKGVVGSSGTLLTTTASTVLRRERHNLRSLSTRNVASPSGLMSANGQRDYAYGKSTTRSGLHATGLCAYTLPSSAAPTPKLLNGAAGVNAAASRSRAHALLMAKQSAGVGAGSASSLCASGVRGGGGGTTTSLTPTSYGKRTTALRSGAVGGGSSASTIMLTRSGGRNGRRLNR